MCREKMYEQYVSAKISVQNFDPAILMLKIPRSGRLVEADKDTAKALINANWRITVREGLNLSNSTVHDHLKGLGLTSKLDIWDPHVLTEEIRVVSLMSMICFSNVKKRIHF
ncbi:histone-lysine N-methyltransferase SETMAR [Trichonephila clavipes]|nr:histone-lysine N-methyltransferase SETMAR [Trichonephila clavipes]